MKNDVFCVLLAFSELTQSHSKMSQDPVDRCWPSNGRWGYLTETAKEGVNISAPGHPLDKQFWTSLWITRAQSYWALTGSSRCPFRAKALLLPCQFQNLPPAPLMLSFPISAHGRTDASKSHVTSCSVHLCAADQYCKPSRSIAQINKWLFWSHSIYGGFPSHAKNPQELPAFPPHSSHTTFVTQELESNCAKYLVSLHWCRSQKSYSISHTTLMWTPNQHVACPVDPSLMAAPSAAGVPSPFVKCYTDQWIASDNWLHEFKPQPIPGKQEGWQDHLSVLGHHTGKWINEQSESIQEKRQLATQLGKKKKDSLGAKTAEPLSSGEI